MKRALIALGVALYFMTAHAQQYQLQTVASGLNYPWSMAFLPSGDYLVSMRSGELRRISASGEVGPPLAGTPAAYVRSQGGYFDIVLDPGFVNNNQVYLAFAHGTASANATRVVRATLGNNTLENIEPIFTVTPSKNTAAHYGGKMVFLPDGSLVLSTGDGFDFRDASQDPHNQLGKVIRIMPDGSLPPDNPFADGQRGDPAVWTYGHRNPQGLAYDATSQTLYLHEHGPKGGDEVNVIEAANNYGWPAVTHGVNYSGAMISPFKTAPCMEDPIKVWVPSIAPSGLAVYRGTAFPAWDGNLLVGALVDKEVRMLVMQGHRVVGEQVLFSEIGERIRDVRVGPDGYIYLLTDGDQGKLIRVTPEN